MPGEARHDLAWKKRNLRQLFFFCGVIYRRRLGCGFLRQSNGDEGAMSKWWLWETSPVLAWKYSKSERSGKQNFHSSGETVQTEKNWISSRNKRFMPAPSALKTTKFMEKLNLLCIHNLHRKCACCCLLLLCISGKMRKQRGKKEKENELGTQFFSRSMLGWVCFFFEWVGVCAQFPCHWTPGKLVGCVVGMTKKKLRPMQPPTEAQSTWLANTLTTRKIKWSSYHFSHLFLRSLILRTIAIVCFVAGTIRSSTRFCFYTPIFRTSTGLRQKKSGLEPRFYWKTSSLVWFSKSVLFGRKENSLLSSSLPAPFLLPFLHVFFEFSFWLTSASFLRCITFLL